MSHQTLRLAFTAVLICLSATVPFAGSVLAEEPPDGIVVNTSPAPQTKYIGSPSIAVLPNGDYIASHVWFGPDTKLDQTVIFRSSDRGKSWRQVAEIHGQFGSTLFVHQSVLYIMGTNRQTGDIVIRRSTDAGVTWGEPDGPKTGLLKKGNFTTAPVPVLVHGGRIWRSMDRMERKLAHTFVISASQDADLLDASSWTVSDSASIAPGFFGGQRDRMIEGNLVGHPDGWLVSLARIENPRPDRAAILPVTENGNKLSLDPTQSFVEMPGGGSKFTVRYDPESRQFWSLTNKQRNPFAKHNVLVLVSSVDLRNWEVKTVLRHHWDSVWHGYGMPDWQFDGKDIVAVCQTAWDGAKSHRHPNMLTFHRFKGFRNLTMSNAASIAGRVRKRTYNHPDFNVEGTQFDVVDFKKDEVAFFGFSLRFTSVPTRFEGWKFSRTNGGMQATIEVIAKRDCEIFFMTPLGGGTIDVTGWSADSGEAITYGSNEMAVYSRSLKQGESVEIPQGNWGGGQLLIPPEQ